MSDTQTPSDIMRSLSAGPSAVPGGADVEAQRRRLSELAKTVASQFEKMKAMQAELARREAEVARHEREGIDRKLQAAEHIGRVEDDARSAHKEIVGMKAQVEVEKRLNDESIAKAREDIKFHAARLDEARQGVERDRAKLQAMNAELTAAREQYQNDRKELEKRHREWQEGNAALKRGVEDLQVKQFRLAKDREALDRDQAELKDRETRLTAREQRFQRIKDEFAGVAQGEERRLAEEKQAEKELAGELEELKARLEADRRLLDAERVVLKAERDRMVEERRKLETEREMLSDERTVFEAEKEEFEEEQGGRMGGRVSGAATPGREENPDAVPTKILDASRVAEARDGESAAEEPAESELDEDLLRAIEEDEPAEEAAPAAADEDPSAEEAEPLEVQPIRDAAVKPRPAPARTPGARATGRGAITRKFPRRPPAPPKDLRQLRKQKPRTEVIGLRVTGVDDDAAADEPEDDAGSEPPPDPKMPRKGPPPAGRR